MPSQGTADRVASYFCPHLGASLPVHCTNATRIVVRRRAAQLSPVCCPHEASPDLRLVADEVLRRPLSHDGGVDPDVKQEHQWNTPALTRAQNPETPPDRNQDSLAGRPVDSG